MAKRRNEAQLETPVEAPQVIPEEPIYRVGDVIRFKGGKCYTSGCVVECAAGNACITVIKPESPHPYHIIHMDHESRVYGWVDEADIEGLPLYRTHTVAVDETLHTIAAMYVTDPDTLMELNGLASSYHIQVGHVIRLPDSQK